jgi:hypothetical protein
MEDWREAIDWNDVNRIMKATEMTTMFFQIDHLRLSFPPPPPPFTASYFISNSSGLGDSPTKASFVTPLPADALLMAIFKCPTYRI